MGDAENEDEGGDLDGQDLTSCKDQIRELQAGRERREETIEQLQEKLKAFNNELAARKEEADRSKKELSEVQKKNRASAEQRREGGVDSTLAKVDKQDKIRRVLEEVLHATAHGAVQRDERGFKIFDEQELMVEKSEAEQEKEIAQIDTVLVTYHVPNTELKYQLSYRVHPQMTTVKKLRRDACEYWGISEVDFVLKNIDNAKVCDELSIQTTFKPEEQAHLILTKKTPMDNRFMDEELAAFGPKGGVKFKSKAKDKKQPAATDQSAPQNEPFETQMQAIPGLYDFMTQRDKDVVAHTSRISPRGMCIYIALLVCNIVMYISFQPPDFNYFARMGMEEPLTAGLTSRDRLTQEFDQIRTKPQAWQWINLVLKDQLMVPGSDLLDSSYLPGYLILRMQQVKSSKECVQELAPSTVTCNPAFYTEEDAGKEVLTVIRNYWEGQNLTNTTTNESYVVYPGVQGTNGRLSSYSPYQYRTGEDTKLGSTPGKIQKYDGSGYVVGYDLQYSNSTALQTAFTDDMAMFQANGWSTNRIRAIHAFFQAYNGNYDLWAYNNYALEMPANGLVLGTAEIKMYRPVLYFEEGGGRTGVYWEAARCILVLYIATFQFHHESKIQMKINAFQSCSFMKALGSYLFMTLSGLADLAIVISWLITLALRIQYGLPLTHSTLDWLDEVKSEKYEDEPSLYASMEQLTTILEAFMITGVAYRLVEFFGVNRQMFLIWHSIAESFRRYRSFMPLFLACLLGIVAIAHAFWRAQLHSFSTYPSALVSSIIYLKGDFDPRVMDLELISTTRPLTIVFFFFSQCLFVLVMTNGWIAVLVNTYQEVRVKAGYDPNDYKWYESKYVVFILTKRCQHIYFKYLRKHIEKPSLPEEQEEE